MDLLDFLVLGGLGTGVVVLLVLLAILEGRRRAKLAVPPPSPRRSMSAAEAHAAVRDAAADDDEITLITVSLSDLLDQEAALEAAAAAAPKPPPPPPAPPPTDEPQIYREPDKAVTIPIVADPEAAEEEPTHASSLLFVFAAGQTDRGLRRKRNEDRFIALDDFNLFVVADGMGGYAGGEVASELACETIARCFRSNTFLGSIEEEQHVPRRGAELAQAIQEANRAIFQRAQREPELKGMGTTIVCARFVPRKERVYIGHIGDSRCYRLRDGALRQLTTDHTMASLGVTGRYAKHLSRAAGVGPGVKVDLIIAKPRIDDLYLLCSDGLTKMVKKDEVIRDVLLHMDSLDEAVEKLVNMANEAGGKDNVTIVLVAVRDPTVLSSAYFKTATGE